jgi:hypothetical protein
VRPKASTIVWPVSSVVAINVPPSSTNWRSAFFSSVVYDELVTQPVKKTSAPASVRALATRMPGATANGTGTIPVAPNSAPSCR